MINNDINIEYFKNDNGIGDGLNGKISHIYIAHSNLEYDPHDIVFYEGNSCEGNIAGLFKSSQEYNSNCKDSEFCSNDKIGSVLIEPSVEKNTIIKLYNSPHGYKDDDWTRIHIGEVNFDEPYCLHGFEHQTSKRDASHNITVVHHAVDHGLGDGLNGKISHVKIAKSTNPNDPDDLVFYDKKDCHGAIAGVFKSIHATNVNCREDESCINDSAKSLLIYPSARDKVAIRVYDDPEGSKSKDDWATIYRRSTDFDKPFCVKSFEHEYFTMHDETTDIKVHFHPHDGLKNGLNGKVSHIKIDDSSVFN